MKRVFLIRGLPGSGKTTLAKAIVGNNEKAVLIEADQFFMKDGKYVFDKTLLPDAHADCFWRFIQALRNPAIEVVVVTNTFTTFGEMVTYIVACENEKIEPNIVVCSNDFGSTHMVPEYTIERMKKRWEAFIPQ